MKKINQNRINKEANQPVCKRLCCRCKKMFPAYNYSRLFCDECRDKYFNIKLGDQKPEIIKF